MSHSIFSQNATNSGSKVSMLFFGTENSIRTLFNIVKGLTSFGTSFLAFLVFIKIQAATRTH